MKLNINTPEPPVPNRVLHIDADIIAYQSACAEEGCKQIDLYSRILNLKELAKASYVKLHLTMGHKGGRELIEGYQAKRKSATPNLEMIENVQRLKVHMCTLPQGMPHYDQEADDGIAQEMLRDKHAVLWSQDKDLRMVGGMHLDDRKGKVVESTWDYGSCGLDESTSAPKVIGYGESFFWHQMLMGDAVDGVKGVPRVGAVRAYDILHGCVEDTQAMRKVVDAYKKAFGDNEWIRHFLDNAYMLWIRPVKGQDIREKLKKYYE